MVSYRIGSGTSLMARVRQVAVMWHFATDAEARLCGCAARRQLGLRKPRLWDLLPTACAWQSPEMLLVFCSAVSFSLFSFFSPEFLFQFLSPFRSEGFNCDRLLALWAPMPPHERHSGGQMERRHGVPSVALTQMESISLLVSYSISDFVRGWSFLRFALDAFAFQAGEQEVEVLKFRHVQSPERAKDRGAGRDGLRGWRQGEGPRGAGSAGSWGRTRSDRYACDVTCPRGRLGDSGSPEDRAVRARSQGLACHGGASSQVDSDA